MVSIPQASAPRAIPDNERLRIVLCHLWAWTGLTILISIQILRNRSHYSEAAVAAAIDVANLQIVTLILFPIVGFGLMFLPSLALVILYSLAFAFCFTCYLFGLIGAWSAMRGRIWRYPLRFTLFE